MKIRESSGCDKMSRRESIANNMARKQSDANAPEMKMVKVAVLPPRLPPGMAPATGLGAGDAFAWDEAVNWQHNQPIAQESDATKKKSFRQKIGLSTQRKRRNEDLPPFVFREVPYDTWRKHYAKDANGKYQGTHAPAEDCLLQPDDVAKWRLGEAKTNADRWTRGTEALPVYGEIRNDKVPGIDDYYDYTMPPGQNPSERQTFEPTIDAPRKTLADGKTAQEIIEEAKNKPKPNTKKSFKEMMSAGARMAMMGN